MTADTAKSSQFADATDLFLNICFVTYEVIAQKDS